MAFNLFSKSKPAAKKDNLEAKQNLDIKQATINSAPLFKNSNSAAPQFPQSNLGTPNNSNFNNPFATNIDSQNPISQNILSSNPLSSQTPLPPQPNTTSMFPPLNETPTQAPVSQPISNSIPISSPPIPNPQSSSISSNFDEISSKPNLDKNQIQELINETVEKLIDEKWEKLISSVEKVLSWKEAQEKQVDLLKEDIVRMSTDVEKIESKILNKISSYDRNILDVNSEIKALDKVFQKITPTLINNVNELSKIAEDFKDLKPKKSIDS